MAVLRFVELALHLVLAADAEPARTDAAQVMTEVEAGRPVKIGIGRMVLKVVAAHVRPGTVERVAEPTMAKPRVNDSRLNKLVMYADL